MVKSATCFHPKFLGALRVRRKSLTSMAAHTMMTYGSETKCFTAGLVNRLRVAQRAMEHDIFGVSLEDQIKNEEIPTRSGITKV